MAFFLHGVHVPHRKNSQGKAPHRMEIPASVTIPLSMHIGAPAKPVVKVGDTVKVGTLIAEQVGVVSSPVYASVSGKVTKIDDIILSNGKTSPAVTVESDGLMEADESVSAPAVSSKEDFIEALKRSGIVGLGGAGFPTYVKYNVPEGKVDTLVINGAECEPYITSDTYTMTDRADDMETAIKAIIKYIGVKRVVIGIENNKKEAIAKMRELASEIEGMEVKVLPALYPQGGEKVLVFHTVGKVIPAGKLPADVGCIVSNCTTVAAIGKYLSNGMPLVEKCITVDGGAVKESANIIAPIGAAFEDVINAAGGFKCEPAKILSGGPMMGISVPDVKYPVLKNTNAIIAMDEKEAKPPVETSCISCGACVNHCPLRLDPAVFAKAYQHGDTDTLRKMRVDICMECGCCSYICPAKRPLVHYNKMAKEALRELDAKKQ